MKTGINSAQAKQISLIRYLAAHGHEPKKTHRGEFWFASPFRPEEKEPSFVVDPYKNVWVDFGMGNEGGSIIDLAMKLHGFFNISSTLSHLTEYKDYRLNESDLLALSTTQSTLFDHTKSSIEIKSVQPLQNYVLRKYLREQRKIGDRIAQKYLKEIWYDNKGRSNLFALGWRNESGAYELRARVRTKDFKAVTGKKDLTILRLTSTPHLFIFEGMIDFLSVLMLKKEDMLDGTVLILNSTALVKRAIDFIQEKEWLHIYSFLDNDQSGQDCLQRLLKEIETPNHYPQTFYKDYKDVNEYLAAK